MAASSPAEGGIDSFFNQISTAIESIKGLVAPALTGAANSKPGDGGGSGQVAMVEMNSSDMLRSAAASVSGYTQPDELVDTSGDRVPDASRQLAGKGRKKGGSISAPDLKGFSDASDSDTSRHGASDRSNAPGKVQSSSGQSGASGGNGRQASAPVVVAAGATAVAAGAVAPAAARPRSALEEARSFLPAFMLLYEECFGEVDVPMDPLALLMVWTEQKELERQRMEHEKGMAERGITQHLRPPPPLGDLCKAMRHSLATYGNTLNNIRMGKTSMAVHAIHKVVDDVTAAAMGDDAAAERNVTAAATIAGISRRDILSARWASERFLPGGYVAVDHDNKWVVLAVRGSLHITDALTNVHAKSVPFLGGWAHEGMAIAARHTAINHLPAIGDALRQFPDYSLIVTGHSLGGGVAALVAMLLHSNDPCVAQAVFQDDDEAAALRLHPMPAITGVRAFCFAPPCVISNTLAQHCAPYVKSVVCGKDVVPRLSISNFKRLVAQLHGKAPVNKALKAFGGAFGGAFTGAFLAGSSPPTGPSGPPRPKLLATKSARSIGPTSLSNDEEFVQQQQRQRPATGGAARNNSGSSSNNDGEGEGSGHWSGHDDIDRGEGDAPLGMPSLDAVVKMFSRMSPPWATLTFGADEARARDPDGAWSLASTPSSSPPGSGASSPPSSSAFDWRGRGNTLQMEHCLMDGCNAVAAGAAGAPPLVVAAGASIDAQMEAPLMTGNRHVSMGPSRAESGSTAAMGPLVLVGAGDLAAVAMMPEGGFDEGSAQDGKKDGKRKLETTFPLAGDASGSAAAPSSSRGGGPADSPPCPTCGLRKHPETDAALAAAQRPAGQPVDPGTSAAATTATANNNTNNNTENNSSNTIKAATRKPPAVLGGRALTGDLSNLDDADADTNAGGWWRRKPSPSTPPPSSSSSQPPATSSGAGSGSNTGATATPGVTAPGTPGGDAAAQQAPSYAAAVLGYKSKGPGSPGSRPGSSGGQGRPPLLERSGVLASGPGELGSSSSGKDLAASSMASSSRGSSSQGGDAVRQDDQGELAARAPHVMPPSGLAGICNCDPPGAPTGMLREERAKAQAASRGKAPLAVLKSDRTRFVDQAPDGSVPADSISLESSIMSAQKDLLFPPGEIVHVINPTSDTPIVAMRDQTAFTEILLSSKMLSDHLPGVYLACLERLHLLENRRMTRQVSSGPDADNPQGDDETWLLADTISGSSRNGRSSRGLWEAVNGGAGVDPEEGVRMVTRAVTSGYSPAHVDGQHTRHRHVHHESIPEVDI
eukprot:jgi/Mesvir1/27642/Mv07372-RA.1